MATEIVILGIGTNLGNRLEHIRQSLSLLKQNKKISLIAESGIYQTKALLPDGAPDKWDIDYFNLAIKISTTLSPIDLLRYIQTVEIKLGRSKNHEFWSPRVIDIDILAWGDLVLDTKELMIPHKFLLDREFALGPLLELEPLWRHPLKSNFDCQRHIKSLPILHLLPFRLHGPKLMGIINLSPESFSKQKTSYHLEENFVQQFISLVNAGAEIIDIGAESTSLNAKELNSKEVWLRLEPLLKSCENLLQEKTLLIKPTISIDTYHDEVVNRLMDYPVDIINDVYGINAERIANIISNSKLKYIFMHNCGKVGKVYIGQQEDPISQLWQYAIQKMDKLRSFGLQEEQLVFDIGLGFGKFPFQVQYIIKNIELLKKLPIPLLVGHSRKGSALATAKHLSAADRDLETAWLSTYLSKKNIDYLRVHNVDYSARMLQLNDYYKV